MSTDHDKHHDPAKSIIAKLGGLGAVASILDVAPQTVLRWRLAGPTRPGEKAPGTGGTIPQRHIPALLAHARANGIDLTIDDFFPAAAAPTEGAAA